MHLDHELLHNFLRGKLDAKENRQVVRHLLSGCEPCRRLARKLWQGEPVPAEIDLAAIARKVWQRGRAFDREKEEAPALVAELEKLSPARQRLVVENSQRFQTRGVCELLTDRARDACVSDVQVALEKALTATALAGRLSAGRYGTGAVHDAQAWAWGVLGEVQRGASKLQESEASFNRAEELLESGSGDLIVIGRVRYLKAFLRHAQGRFEDALELFRSAAREFRAAGDTHLEGSTLVDRGRTLRQVGDLEGAVRAVRAGLEMIDPARSPRMELVAKHNLALFLQELGRAEEALGLVGELLTLHTQLGGEVDQLRLRWLEGKLANLKGDLDRAQDAFEEVRAGLESRSMPYDQALVSLDLAGVYLVRERFGEVLELAGDMLAVFRALEIDREAIAALFFLQEAVRARSVSLALLGELGTYLKRVQREPGLVFRPSQG